MAVMMQAFYWDAPIKEQKEGEWWNHHCGEGGGAWRRRASMRCGCRRSAKAPRHARRAMTPTTTSTSATSTRRVVKTLYGNRAELENLIGKLHEHKIGAYADMVINHNSGADEEEVNPIDGQKRWTKFNPKTGKFPRDWNCFHPCRYERVMIEGENFAGFPHLCHRNPRVYDGDV